MKSWSVLSECVRMWSECLVIRDTCWMWKSTDSTITSNVADFVALIADR